MKKIALFLLCSTFLISCSLDNDNGEIVDLCEIPSEITISNITNNSVTISWTNNNVNKSVAIEYGAHNYELGTGIINQTIQNSITIENLNDNTSYDFYLQAVCSNSVSMVSTVHNFTTAQDPVVSEFLLNLSDLNLFSGDLANLTPADNVFEYQLGTPLYTDYAYKQRLLALPVGTKMTPNGDGFPDFPEGTVMAKTFYYYADESDQAMGRDIIETRLLIKKNNIWELGNYVWNEEQTDAALDSDEHIIPITWLNMSGETKSIDYIVPKNADCIVCHQSFDEIQPIGPQLRSMNHNIEGTNQLQHFINNDWLDASTDPSSIDSLPDWNDENLSTETRVRAYFDMNCAHCHSAGGYHNVNYYDALNLNFETAFAATGIFEKRFSIMARMPGSIQGYSMPYIGVTTPHTEALDLILPYLESLE